MSVERPVSSIPTRRLRELEAKERAHDDYLEAMRRLREDSADLQRPATRSDPWVAGFVNALTRLSQHIVDVGNERPVPHG